jgi:CTP:molybdopterin cytidylyltransferase MocA
MWPGKDSRYPAHSISNEWEVARRNDNSLIEDTSQNGERPSALAIRNGLVYSAASFRMTDRTKIVPIILAAGSSESLGVPKALARFGKKTALFIAIENCLGLERPIVVLGHDAKLVRLGVPRAARVVVNWRWREGQLSSLLCGLDAVASAAAVLIYPVDHPLLEKRTVTQIVKEFRRRKLPEEIVMPRHRGRYGHPIILSSALRKELSGAATTREVVYRIPERIRSFDAGTSAIYEDFDNPEIYKRCLRKFVARRRSHK